LNNYISAGSNTVQFVENDAVVGKDAYRINLKSGKQDVTFNIKNLGIENISQSLWIDIYNDSDKTLEIPVKVKRKGSTTYASTYESFHLDKTMTITLKPGMNHIEINGYALISGERAPQKVVGIAESLQFNFTNYSSVLKLAVTNMYVEKG